MAGVIRGVYYKTENPTISYTASPGRPPWLRPQSCLGKKRRRPTERKSVFYCIVPSYSVLERSQGYTTHRERPSTASLHIMEPAGPSTAALRRKKTGLANAKRGLESSRAV